MRKCVKCVKCETDGVCDEHFDGLLREAILPNPDVYCTCQQMPHAFTCDRYGMDADRPASDSTEGQDKRPMSVERKVEMVVSMLDSVKVFGLTPSEIDTFVSELIDYRDSIDTELHEKLRTALADTTVARVLVDPKTECVPCPAHEPIEGQCKWCGQDAFAALTSQAAATRTALEELVEAVREMLAADKVTRRLGQGLDRTCAAKENLDAALAKADAALSKKDGQE